MLCKRGSSTMITPGAYNAASIPDNISHRHSPLTYTRAWFVSSLILSLCLNIQAAGQTPDELLTAVQELPNLPAGSADRTDWLIDASNFTAGVFRTTSANEIALDNGLIRRVFRISPNGATVAYDNLTTETSMLRGVKPEALVTINGDKLLVGGLAGQPNYAYLLPEWLDTMEGNPGAMQLAGFSVGETRERFPWKRVRRHASNLSWPPKGTHLRMDYRLPSIQPDLPLKETHEVQWLEDFRSISDAWTVRNSSLHPRTSFENEGKAGEIYAPAGTFCFAERTVDDGTTVCEAVIDPGTDSGVSWGPGLALVFEDRIVRLSMRCGDRGEHGHFELRNNGLESLATIDLFAASDGGLDTSTPYRLRAELKGENILWSVAAANSTGPAQEIFRTRLPESPALQAIRVGKMDRQAGPTDNTQYPGDLGRCRIIEVGVYGPSKGSPPTTKAKTDSGDTITVSVHYELYDGMPTLSKWITVQNNSSQPITIDRFTSELLALVEHSSYVEAREAVPLDKPQFLHVETDFAFGGMTHQNANRHVIHWRPDPQYTSQVNYLRQTPCLLAVEPTYGPAQTVTPGKQFESFRTFELAYDSSDRERNGLALRRMYRTLAPWVTENPLMHHLLNSNPQQVIAAVEQAAEVGFEMIILSFGSGFNMDNENAEYLQQWRRVADYAESKGIEIGSYSLLSSRSAPAGNMIVSPEGQRPTHGQCPALASPWGQAYLKRLRTFFAKTGFDLLEHDGSYPGDVDVTARPPLQKGALDSRWVQWRMITDYYRWCRSRGIFLNVPDYYFLNGANKTGMGYREVNWSLPRAMQVIHTRQNIFDGTWTKTPSMGWMFVPLSQYHGGGAAATVEPLSEHLDHYGRMLDSNLALGVQACYRGPRLFDTDRTKAVLQQRVAWFKKYREILESDLVHGRRADGRDLDWMLHVNPTLEHKGMLIVFNPLKHRVQRELEIDLYYTGLTETALVTASSGERSTRKLARNYTVKLPVDVQSEGMSWYLIEQSSSP